MWTVAGSILTKPRPQVHAGPLRLSAVLYCEKLPRCPRLAVDVDVRDQCDQVGVELSLSSCRSAGRQSGPTFRLRSNHLVPIRLWREYRVPSVRSRHSFSPSRRSTTPRRRIAGSPKQRASDRLKRQNAVKLRKPAAGRRAAPQLRPHHLDGIHGTPQSIPVSFVQIANLVVDVERTVHLHRFLLPDRRRSLGKHGAGYAAWRPPRSLEPKHLVRNRRGRHCRVQRQGEGYSDCAPRRAQVWRRVGALDILSRYMVRLTQYRPKAKLLTKGDNNGGDDTELYAKGQDFLEREDILGYVLKSSYAVRC